MAQVTYREALRQGLREALHSNPSVFLMGEDVGRYGGAFAVSKGLLEEFGPDRIMDVPLSESGFTGAGIGAAMGGLRPVVELMTVNFSLLAFDQIVNNAATLLHMSGGQVRVPLVIRIGCGVGRQLAAQHSHSWEPLFAHIPGLRVLAAGTHEDARGMLREALKCSGPVVIFEYTSLLNTLGDEGPDTFDARIEKAKIRRAGRDVSLITYGNGVSKALEAAAELALSGIETEVLDLRSLRPIDEEAVLASVRKTHRAFLVEDAWRSLSLSAEISARIMENAFYDLDAPVRRLCGREVPIPYPRHLEEASVPQKDQIVAGIKTLCKP